MGMQVLLWAWRNKILEEIYPKTILRKQGIAAIEAGTWTVGTDGDLETPLIDNKDCAYVILMAKPLCVGSSKPTIKDNRLENRFPVICIQYV
jgi:hypothetical protein